VIRWFWEVVHGWTNEQVFLSPVICLAPVTHCELTWGVQRKALLAFATGLVRAPIKGLKALNFCIQRAGPDSDRYALCRCFLRRAKLIHLPQLAGLAHVFQHFGPAGIRLEGEASQQAGAGHRLRGGIWAAIGQVAV
jgi:hypothetical protein